jgi:hypothetical protein
MYWAQTKIIPVYTYIMERGGSSDIISTLNSTQAAAIFDATQLIDKAHTQMIIFCYFFKIAYAAFAAHNEHAT